MSSVIVCLGYTGCTIGLIQGLVWTILSLCAVLIRYKAWVPEEDTKTNAGILNKVILDAYIQGSEKYPFKDVIITVDALTYWLFAYIVLSAAWSLLSMWQFFVLIHKKKSLYKTIFPIWTGCTCVISVFDLILTILLGVDYNNIIKLVNKEDGGPAKVENAYAILATGVVMTIAARGFVLWVVNVIVSIALTVLQYQDKEEVSDILRQHINAYEASNASQRGKENYGFDWDYEKPKPSTTSFEEVHYTQPEPMTTRQAINEQIAKIGRARGTTTPTKVLSPQLPHTFLHPRVPSPDYSPIQERKNGQAKSALKIRSQNMYGTQF